MHDFGWVHRDISSENILVVDGVGKIADLEYAKERGADTHHFARSVCPDPQDDAISSCLPFFVGIGLLPSN